MYKVIIVDDEVHICSLIKNLLKIENIPVVIDQCFYEGEESLKYILENKPDIVITDIQMGDMSGLDIISKVRQQNQDTLFIIISGYNYFDYAKQAIQYGVDNYLLKPIQRKELSQAMNKVMAKLDERNGRKKNIQEMMNQKRESDERIFIQELWYRGRETGRCKTEEIERKYGLSFKKAYFITGIVHMDSEANYDEENTAVLMDRLTEEFRKMMRTSENVYAAGNVSGRNFCFIVNCRMEEESAVTSLLKNYARKMAELYSNNNLKISVSISLPCEWGEDIQASMEAAKAGIAGRLQIKNRRVITPGDIEYTEDREYVRQIRRLEERISDLLETMELKQIREECRNVFLELYKQGKSYEVTEASRKIMDFLGKKAEELGAEEKMIPPGIDIINESFRDIKAFYDTYMQHIDSLLEILEFSSGGAEKKVIIQVKEYLKDHYCEHIELDDLSKQVYLTPAYLGALFKESTGKTIKEYLTELRMKKAKQLLGDIRYNVNEVAEQTGYSDAKYFSKIFKKTVGIKPTEYRKIHHKLDL